MFVFNLIFCSLMLPHFFILRLGDFYLHVFLGSCKKKSRINVFLGLLMLPHEFQISVKFWYSWVEDNTPSGHYYKQKLTF